MSTHRLQELIDAWRDSALSHEQTAELNAILRESDEAREIFRIEAQMHGLLHAAVMATVIDETSDKLIPRASPSVSTRRAWLQWRPLAAAAAGLLIGLFSASVVFAYAVPKFSDVKAVVRQLLSESFESGATATLPGLPREAGVWSGDEARVVAAESGLQPKSGAKMLRFVSATFAGESGKLNLWSDVYRLVDLRGQVSEGRSVLRVSASFDALPFPAGEEYSCRAEICAFENDLTDAPQPLHLAWVRENCTAEAKRKFPMKGNGVWQEATAEVPVSPLTRFVLVHLAVQRRRPHTAAEPVQFGGHYLDDVKLELITQPNIP